GANTGDRSRSCTQLSGISGACRVHRLGGGPGGILFTAPQAYGAPRGARAMAPRPPPNNGQLETGTARSGFLTGHRAGSLSRHVHSFRSLRPRLSKVAHFTTRRNDDSQPVVLLSVGG